MIIIEKLIRAKTAWISLVRQGYRFAVSVITKYEIYTGATANQLQFWNSIFTAIEVLPLNESCIDTAVKINAELKRKRKQIALADLLIASTAMQQLLVIVMLNEKHFSRIDNIQLIK